MFCACPQPKLFSALFFFYKYILYILLRTATIRFGIALTRAHPPFIWSSLNQGIYSNINEHGFIPRAPPVFHCAGPQKTPVICASIK